MTLFFVGMFAGFLLFVVVGIAVLECVSAMPEGRE